VKCHGRLGAGNESQPSGQAVIDEINTLPEDVQEGFQLRKQRYGCRARSPHTPFVKPFCRID